MEFFCFMYVSITLLFEILQFFDSGMGTLEAACSEARWLSLYAGTVVHAPACL